jgi:two-component sensor histidine kinase
MGAGRDLYALAKDGSLLPVEIGLNPVSNGGKKGVLATVIDISERKNLERRAQLLADEVSHRARNLLTVVQALALRKLPKEASTEFMRTLDALARTQKIFGGQTVAPLHLIVEAELADFRAQTTISGCQVLLTPAAGQDFSLIIHELATNALKYGALSKPEGTIDVEGHEGEDGNFRLTWTERGGPRIDAKPKRHGHGRQILQEIAKGLRAQMQVDYSPDGVRYELAVPIERIANVSELEVASKRA